MVIDPAFPGFRDEFMKVSAAGSRSVRSRKKAKARRGSPRRALRFAEGLVLLTELDNAKCAVTVIVVARGEKQLIGISVGAGRTALTELNGPHIVNFNRLSARVTQRAKERPALRIKRVDPSVWRIVRNQQRIAHRAEIAGRQGNAPRRMQRSAYCEVRLQNTRRRKRIDKTALRLVKRRIGDPDRFDAIRVRDGLNAVRCEFFRNFRVNKSLRIRFHEFEIGVKHIDPAILSIVRGVQERLPVVGGNRQACVRGAGRRPVGGRCCRARPGRADTADRGIPSADSAIQRRENENR